MSLKKKKMEGFELIVLLQGQFKVLVAGCHHAYVEKSVKSEQRLYGEEGEKIGVLEFAKWSVLIFTTFW